MPVSSYIPTNVNQLNVYLSTKYELASTCPLEITPEDVAMIQSFPSNSITDKWKNWKHPCYGQGNIGEAFKKTPKRIEDQDATVEMVTKAAKDTGTTIKANSRINQKKAK